MCIGRSASKGGGPGQGLENIIVASRICNSMDERRLHRLFSFGIALLFIPSIYTGFFPNKITLISFLCGWMIILLFLHFRKMYDFSEFDGRRIFAIFVLFNVVMYIRGFFNIDSNTDIYALACSLFFLCFLIPAYMLLAQSATLTEIWKCLLIPGAILCVICYLYPSSDGMMTMAHNASFLNVFLLFIPFVSKKWRRRIILAALVVALLDVDRRSILACTFFSLGLGMFANIVLHKIVKTVFYWALILVPIILFALGITGTFNIFQYMEDSYSYRARGGERDMFVDSRTAIYEDVFTELSEKDAIVWGLGGNGKTRTSLTELKDANYAEKYKYGRPGTESGMLNYIQYGGLIGFLVYGLLLIVGSFRAVFKSNNQLMALIGLFVAFKFLFSFLEDRIGFQPASFYLFLTIGMCYNVRLREMDDDEMTDYIQQVFT